MKRREAMGLAAGGGLATLLSERTAAAEAQVERTWGAIRRRDGTIIKQ